MHHEFPDNLEVDLHDIAALILDAHWRSDTRFRYCQLVEILGPNSQPQTFHPNVIPPEWYNHPSPSKVGYILRYPTPGYDSCPPNNFSIDEFLHPEGVTGPTEGGSGEATRRNLSRKEIEDIYWRCKLYDNGYLITYVAQQVLRSLPSSTTINVRTSTGVHTSFKPSPETIMVNEFPIQPKKPCMILNYCSRPDVSLTAIGRETHLTGFTPSTPWIYLILGRPTSTDIDEDTRIVLDLAITQLGGRGGGNELFALEKGSHYHAEVLSQVADELPSNMKLSLQLTLTPPHLKWRGNGMVERVLKRLRSIVVDGVDDFCRYCGKADVDTRCSRCKKAHLCSECHVLAWKYHKKWCRP